MAKQMLFFLYALWETLGNTSQGKNLNLAQQTFHFGLSRGLHVRLTQF